jgi:hypothetical protein
VTRQEVVPFRSQSATSTAEMAYDAGSGKCVLRLAWRIRAYARPMSVASRPVNTGASTSSMTAEAADGAYVQPSPDTHREGSPKATVVDAAARTGWYATPGGVSKIAYQAHQPLVADLQVRHAAESSDQWPSAGRPRLR